MRGSTYESQVAFHNVLLAKLETLVLEKRYQSLLCEFQNLKLVKL